MTARFGGATEAAEILGKSLSQFNAIRVRVTYVYDPLTQSLLRPTEEQLSDRQWLQSHHLTAPTLAGQSLPRSPWEYRLDLLAEYRELGWPGARYPLPPPSPGLEP